MADHRTAALCDLTRFGHRGCGKAWRLDADTGHRTPGRPDWILLDSAGMDTGHSHRTRGQGDQGTASSRTSWATTPNDRLAAPHRVRVDGAGGARQPMQARRSGPLPARETPTAEPGSCSVARRRRPSGASAHCSPQLDFEGTAVGNETKAGWVVLDQRWWGSADRGPKLRRLLHRCR
jgi:hypothetical protein